MATLFFKQIHKKKFSLAFEYQNGHLILSVSTFSPSHSLYIKFTITNYINKGLRTKSCLVLVHAKKEIHTIHNLISLISCKFNDKNKKYFLDTQFKIAQLPAASFALS